MYAKTENKTDWKRWRQGIKCNECDLNSKQECLSCMTVQLHYIGNQVYANNAILRELRNDELSVVTSALMSIAHSLELMTKKTEGE